MKDEIIHFPGQTMRFGPVIRQRCVWCGALIIEYDLTNIGIPENGRPDDLKGKPIDPDRELSFWGQDGKSLVAISGTNPKVFSHVDAPADGNAPDRSCMVLMPAEP